MAPSFPAPASPQGPAPISNTTPTEYDPNIAIEAGEDPGQESEFTTGSFSSLTQSVTSSVRDYIYENGRRYHRYGAPDTYLLPNDETEQDRLDLQHHVMLQILNGALHVAPIGDEVHRVLDCGTGTGIWALDFGEIHTETQVIGVDLSPIQPTWVYSNVKFEVDDLEKDWTWPSNYFDFIHARAIEDGIRDHSRLVKQMYDHVRPGGYVEISEIEHDLRCDDGTMDGSNLKKYLDLFKASCMKAGQKFVDGEYTKKVMEDAGFVDVVVHTYILPWGPWPKDKRLKRIGHTYSACLETGFEAFGLGVLTKFGGCTVEEAKKLCADAMADILSRKVHTYNFVWQVVGRKPEAEK